MSATATTATTSQEVHCIRVGVHGATRRVASLQFCYRYESADETEAHDKGELISLLSGGGADAEVYTLELLAHQYVVCARWCVSESRVRALRFGTNCGQWSQWYGDASFAREHSALVHQEECADGRMLVAVSAGGSGDEALCWTSATAVRMRALMKTAPVAGFEVATSSPIPRVKAGQVLIRIEMAVGHRCVNVWEGVQVCRCAGVCVSTYVCVCV
jgi:hypothetical protein